ncbi:hypothetical protein T440DRAFT_2804 [Plenodomus tracheiphilus IPT5]|uniref:Uncharacterized protein n=1 Tax=Plenodomus tracheiphilus IPT5 TaxID=1408161 RepID=A0A6A7BMX9_9PLEO|nr:hypothetical protein T440DRAFT_2804 [Plenodomus tracheiphilus IPT5]
MNTIKLPAFRQLPRAPLAPASRPHITTIAPCPSYIQTHIQTQTRQLSVPTILRPSFWSSMVPKPLKTPTNTTTTTSTHPPATRPWNPATPYIILSLLVGSQAIQVLWLKQERAASLRKAEAKIGILKEVIERVQRGEKVDVEGVLGVGDVENEKAWAEVLKEVKDEEALFQSRHKRKALRQAAESEAKDARRDGDEEKAEKARIKVESLGGVKFY